MMCGGWTIIEPQNKIVYLRDPIKNNILFKIERFVRVLLRSPFYVPYGNTLAWVGYFEEE